MSILKEARNVREKIGNRIDYDGLLWFARVKGWDVIEFGHDAARNPMYADLKIDPEKFESDAFTFQAGGATVIMLSFELSERQKAKALAHEFGHLTLKHNLSLVSPREEAEADKFAAALLGQKNKKKAICIVLAGILAIAITLALVFCIPRAPQNIDNPRIDDAEAVYITSDGDCYHNKDCIFVLGKSNVIQISIVDALVLGMRPCSVCRGD